MGSFVAYLDGDFEGDLWYWGWFLTGLLENLYFVRSFPSFTSSKKDTILFVRKTVWGKYPSYNFEKRQNHEIKIKPLIINELNVPDEYDTNYICKLFEQYRRAMVRGEYPGCGKSYACKEMEN